MKPFLSWIMPIKSQRGKFSSAEIGHYYDEWTPKYMEVFGDTFQAYRTKDLEETHRYILERSGMKTGDHILDAGCGICGPSVYFAKSLNVTIEAITISDVQVQQAVDKIDAADVGSQVSVRKADYHEIDKLFPANHFDVVLFLESFSHASYPWKLLKAAHRVLKPGGTLYIKDYFRNTALQEGERQKMNKVVANVDATFRCNTPTFEHLVNDIERAGFNRVFVDQVQYETDNSVWNAFDTKHDFNLYDRVNYCMWVMWGELCYRK
jgi:cyclopropane fatty-acyl-phospholipid synthase-like methyltransferase